MKSPPIAPVILSLLSARQRITLLELCAETGAVKQSIERVVARLRKAGEIHVSKWTRSPCGGPNVPHFSIGPGSDAKKLKPLTNSEKSERYRNNNHSALAAKATARRRVRCGTVVMDPIMAALLGYTRVRNQWRAPCST